MSILSSDIQYRLSGGAANADPLVSLGGTKSSSNASSNLFDDVTTTEAQNGKTEYRCIYVHNANSTTTLTGAVLWINSNTPSATTDVAIALGSSGLNGTEASVANESTAPTGLTFVAAADKTNGIALGDIPAGQSQAVWVRRIVGAGTAALSSDPFTLRVEGGTA